MTMKKWEMLKISSTSSSYFLACTSPTELKTLVTLILKEGLKYFAYVKKAGKLLEIKVTNSSVKGHRVELWVSPWSEYFYDDHVNGVEFLYFIVNTLKENGWEPYPGDGSGERFIKYLK